MADRHWMTRAALAASLGITQRTISRRLRRGEIDKRGKHPHIEYREREPASQGITGSLLCTCPYSPQRAAPRRLPPGRATYSPTLQGDSSTSHHALQPWRSTMEIRITFDLTDRLADMLERGLDLIEDQATQPTALIADDNADDAALQAKYDAEYRDSPVFRNGDDHLELPSGFQETIDRASDKGDDGLEEARDYDYDHSLPVVVDDTDKLDALDDRRKDDLAPAVTIPTPAVKPKKKQAKIHTFDCAHCGASFSTAKRKARYCSQDCYFAQKRAG